MSGTLFASEERYGYVIYPRHASFDAFVDRVMGQTFNSHDRAQVVTDEVRSLFEAGKTPAGDYRFEQPMLINLYRGVKG